MKSMTFNSAMGAAIYAGRKTATWRMMKPQPQSFGDFDLAANNPPHRPGDRLLVKEPWAFSLIDGRVTFDQEESIDGIMARESGMPLTFARSAITILTVEPRRLCSVTDSEARDDGFEDGFPPRPTVFNSEPLFVSARHAFDRAIRDIYKLNIGDDPWGWRFTFRAERLDESNAAKVAE